MLACKNPRNLTISFHKQADSAHHCWYSIFFIGLNNSLKYVFQAKESYCTYTVSQIQFLENLKEFQIRGMISHAIIEKWGSTGFPGDEW